MVPIAEGFIVRFYIEVNRPSLRKSLVAVFMLIAEMPVHKSSQVG